MTGATTSHATPAPVDIIGTLKKSFVRLNMPVFPLYSVFDGKCTCGDPECVNQGKHPIVGHWKEDSTTNNGRIHEWIDQYGRCNWGGATGKISGVFAVDIDPRHGGDKTFNDLEKTHGKVPDTRIHRTGGGGVHIIFAVPRGMVIPNITGVLPGIDIKGENAYIVLPPSRHISGGEYSILNDVPPADPPEWLIKLIQNGSGIGEGKPTGYRMPDTIPAGERTTTLFSAARSMRMKGFSEEAISAAIQIENEKRCVDPPVPERKLQGIIRDASRNYEAGTIQTDDSYHYSDVGMAHRLIRRFGHVARYCRDHKSWYLWNGTRWERDTTNQIIKFAKTVIQETYTEIAMIEKEKERESCVSALIKCELASRIKGMVALAEPEAVVLPEILDKDPNLFNLKNGTLDLTTLTIREHRKEDLITKMAGVPYVEGADCPLWTAHLFTVFGEKEENVEVIKAFQKACGLSLLRDNPEQIFFITWGTGSNGKSTTLRVLEYIWNDYAVAIASESFMQKKFSDYQPRPDILRLKGARVGITTENEKKGYLAEALVKAITGGDTLTFRGLYKEEESFHTGVKMWFNTNHKPRISSRTFAIWRRIVLWPFTVTIDPKKRDRGMVNKLIEEGPGILNWCVEGLRLYREEGFIIPKLLQNVKDEYKSDEDVLGEWLRSGYVVVEEAQKAKSSVLYEYYKTWFAHAHTDEKPLSQQAWGRLLSETHEKKRESDGLYYLGLGVPGQSNLSGINV